MTGVSSDELYSRQDFNAQHELWGHFFEESTRGSMLATSLVASVGYASPIQSYANRFRDFLLQFESYSSLMDSFEANARIVACCIFSIPFTLAIFTTIIILKRHIGLVGFLFVFALVTTPFLGLAAASFHHKYNYLIYHSYTQEFSFIFILISFLFFKHSEKISQTNISTKLLRFFITGSCLALPIIYNIKTYSSLIEDVFNRGPSTRYENQERFGSSKFSNSLQLISKDTNSPLDICFFLCSGDMADHRLRTKMRSLSLHFAKDNLNKYDYFQSSTPLTVYCLLDESLLNDYEFMNTLKKKFPSTSKFSIFAPKTLKVELIG